MRFDSHYHLGEVYYGRKSKHKTIKTTLQETLDYIDTDKITHLSCLYTSHEKSLLEDLISKTECKILPFLWVSSFEEQYDKNLNVGVKLHQRRNHDQKEVDLSSRVVRDYLNSLPDYTPIMVHTQDGKLDHNLNFTGVVDLAVSYPKLKFIICHAGAAGVKSLIPSTESFKNNTATAKQLLKGLPIDMCLTYGSLWATYFFNNIWVDLAPMSCNVYLKTLVMASSPWMRSKIMLGTDRPFFKFRLSDEERVLKRYYKYTDEEICKIHERALDYILKDVPDESHYHNKLLNSEILDNMINMERGWKYIPRGVKNEAKS